MSGKIVQIERQRQTRPRPSLSRAIATGALVLVAAAGAAPLAGCGSQNAPPASQSGGPGGPFSLVDENGRPVDQGVLKGKWTVVFFGYSYCPDVCPATLTVLGQAMDQLGPLAKDAQVVFITVDPARDTPAHLKAYLSSPVFPKNIIGLTGSATQIAQAAKAYGVYYEKAGGGANYTVDHSVVLYLMDPQGRFKRPIAEGITPEETRRQIAEAMNGA